MVGQYCHWSSLLCVRVFDVLLDAWGTGHHITKMPDTANDQSPKPLPEKMMAEKQLPKKQVSETRDFVVFLVKLIAFVTIFRTFFIAPFNIPTESMVPRLIVGDYLFVAKWPYGYSKYSMPFSLPLIPGRIFASTPERGDVAVFKAPPTNTIDYVKRVIGVAGDRVQIKQGQIILNGKPIPKKRIADFMLPLSPNTSACFPTTRVEQGSDGFLRCRYPRFVETLPNGKSYEVLDTLNIERDNTEEFVVPKGYLFMMGDNRDNSLDSRFSVNLENGIGLVPEENLIGRAVFSVFSTDGSAQWLLPWTWFSAARWSRIGEGF
jgi:signal peptidase I